MKKKFLLLFLSISLIATPLPVSASENADASSSSLIESFFEDYIDDTFTVNKYLGYSKEDGEAIDEAYNVYSVEEIEKEKYTGTYCYADTEDYIEVFSEASEDSEVLGKMKSGAQGVVLSVGDDGWMEISSGNIESGWVKKEDFYTLEEAEEKAEEFKITYAKVIGRRLNIRTEASTSSSVLGSVPKDEELVVVGMDGDWVQVDIEEGYGWVSSKYVVVWGEFTYAETLEEEEAREEAEEEAREAAAEAAEAVIAEDSAYDSSTIETTDDTDSSTGQAVVNYASQFLGNPYVWGGTSLTNGADCSGFVKSVYAHFGITLPHSSTALRSVGYEVEYSEVQPGDIICYSGHVAIYAGNGKIIHASSAATGIKISNAEYKTILCVRRIF